MAEFTENLDYLLKKKGMTRKDLAPIIGVSPSTISAWYNRSYDGVALKTLKAIAKYFNVTLDYLVYGDMETEEESIRGFSQEEIETLKHFVQLNKEIIKQDAERLQNGEYSYLLEEIEE